MLLKYFLFLFLPILAGPFWDSIGEASPLQEGKAVIYYSEACAGCSEYLNDTLIPALKGLGVRKIDKKDYVNNPANRKELWEYKQKMGVPMTLQAHITTLVNETIILEGHIPQGMIEEVWSPPIRERYPRILLYQDEMHKPPTHYQVWVFKGKPQTFPIGVSLFQALPDLKTHPPPTAEGEKLLLPVVLATGFLDGINPCAFAVLLFFIALLFTMKRTRHNISRMGITYILAIYLTYFLIGLGLLKALAIAGSPHWMAKVGAYLVILLGAVHLKDYFLPGLPISLRVPKIGQEAVTQWAYKATFPATFILGVLVGLCTFPCSGGIYVAMIGLIQSKVTFYQGLGYLTLYNLMFVLPLVAILVVASSRLVAGRLVHWERVGHRSMHLFSGTIMIGLGAVILVWAV